MALKVNEAAIKNAKKLIEEGKITTEGSWSQAQPSTGQEDKYVQQHGWNDYAKWYLAINTDKKTDEKQHYEFPIGNFKQVNREGLIAAKRRAAQYKHLDIEKAADQLLQLIEKKNTIKTK